MKNLPLLIKVTAILLLIVLGNQLAAQNDQQQDVSRLSGNFQSTASFYIPDSAIGAVGQPQYDRQLYGADAWLQLNYSNWGFDVGVRFDLFNNSQLLNPNGSYTAQGIGRWFIKKQVKKLGLSVGYLYDQIGSGIIFRAYEARGLAIDNALYGARATYDLTPNWQLKAFTGLQKRQFDTYAAVIKGFSAEGFIQPKNEKARWSLAPGIGIVGRTLDDQTVNTLVNTIATYDVVDSIGARYNTYAFTLYNTLTAGDFSWYVEGAYKTGEAYFDPFAIKTNRDGSTSLGKLGFSDGNILYTSLSYAGNGLGINLDAKRTEKFTFRVDPFQTGVQGFMNYLPALTRINTNRLNAYYNAAIQELGELAFQADITYAFSRKLRFNVNVSRIDNLSNELLYREYHFEGFYKYKRKWTLSAGVQVQNYNQEVYEVKPGVPIVKTFTPFAEFLYKFNRKKSIRIESQVMLTDQDFGNWLFGLVEFNVAPHWSFTVSEMYNFSPTKRTDGVALSYPRVDVFYTSGANRYSLSFVKQVQGIVCAGGVCRLEPSFSGVRLSVNSSF